MRRFAFESPGLRTALHEMILSTIRQACVKDDLRLLWSEPTSDYARTNIVSIATKDFWEDLLHLIEGGNVELSLVRAHDDGTRPRPNRRGDEAAFRKLSPVPDKPTETP